MAWGVGGGVASLRRRVVWVDGWVMGWGRKRAGVGWEEGEMRQHLGKRTQGFFTTILASSAFLVSGQALEWPEWPGARRLWFFSELVNLQLFTAEDYTNIIIVYVCPVLSRRTLGSFCRLLDNTLDQRNNWCLWNPNSYLVNSTNVVSYIWGI